MVSAWSSHDLDGTNQETPYRPVRCLLTPGTAPCIHNPMQQSRRAACQLPCCLAVLPWASGWGLYQGPAAPRAKRIVVPGGPCQYYAVHQYSVVRRVWGTSGVAGFLIFAPRTPPQDLIAGILSTHVRCSPQLRCTYI